MPSARTDLDLIAALRRNIESVIIGKSTAVRLLVTAMLARGHVLIEDIPGIGKTSLVRALSRSVSGSFRRIQFTPDLLPSDVTGLSVFDPGTKDFTFKQGPIFANIVLADEINRTPPRTQAALLEAMNENRVSVDGITHSLPSPFMVVATQNPLEFTGTYPLPESQLDRFLMILSLGYPSPDEEREILESRRAGDPVEALKPALTASDAEHLCGLVPNIRLDSAITQYMLDIVGRTRNDRAFVAGVSPRGTLHLSRASQAYAMVDGRDYVTPDDVKAVAVSVLAHRIVERRRRSSHDGRLSGGSAIRKILQDVAVPQ